MTEPIVRKGASRAADIPPDVLGALERGELEIATLAEGLALNQARLLRAVFPALDRGVVTQVEVAGELGILKRMARIGAILLSELGSQGVDRCQTHASDTVRGWACFIVGAQAGLDLEQRLARIRPLADDGHFGVREWAWMAVRPRLVAELGDSIALLSVWTESPSEYLRRFASEALRPRGVWCAHTPALKYDPALGLPLLEPLRADDSTYVQNSVGNWLNDAAKDRPDWVRSLCDRWREGDPPIATHRICDRALRNIS